ncbi:MAG TPA: glutaredoxin domain-containing protein [Candidatus Colwellbacteria bacterium]|nr:glutaredoxin domain-containing protein [Candidatus Colwellbacteria bacterium]
MKVKIYSTPVCVYCRMAKEFFKKNNVEFEEVNVAVDRQAAEEMVMKSHQMGVPVIDIDGEIFLGFNRRDLEEKLGIR